MSNSNVTLTVTPGYQWVPGEVWTADKANAAAMPVINFSGDLGSITLGPGVVALSNLQAALFSNDAAGRVPFADGWLGDLRLINTGLFTADATGRGKFANGFVNLALMQAAMFTADDAGRAPFAPGSVNAAMLQPDAGWYVSAGGTGSAYTVSPSPSLTSYLKPDGTQKYTAYWDGLLLAFRLPATCAAGATLDAGLGAKPLYRNNGTAVRAFDLGSGTIIEVRYNTNFNSGTGAWQLLTAVALGDKATLSGNDAAYNVAQTLTRAHGLNALPRSVRWVLQCTGTEGGYAVGVELDLASLRGNGPTTGSDTTNVYLNWPATTYQLVNSAGAAFTPAVSAGKLTNWQFTCYVNL